MSDIIIAPFSNSDIRDWPAGHYAAMIALLLERWTGPGLIRVIGTANQKIGACDIVRHLPATRVVNECGRMSWAEVLASLKSAACIVGNNSGVCHLGGYFGAPTVCVFGGSHQRLEWRPLGFSVVVVSRAIGCSPCQLDHGHVSPFGKACLREIEPETVAEAALQIMRRVAEQRRSQPSLSAQDAPDEIRRSAVG